jgi:predicted  nucleic acid-binding Zn-ribbon protein
MLDEKNDYNEYSRIDGDIHFHIYRLAGQLRIDAEQIRNTFDQIRIDVEQIRNDVDQIQIDAEKIRNAVDQIRIDLYYWMFPFFYLIK